MGSFIARSSGTNQIIIFRRDEFIGKIEYKSLYSMEADVLIGDANSFQITVEGVWQHQIFLKSGQNVLMEMKNGWRELLITDLTDHPESDYFLRYKTICGSVFELVNQNNNVLITAAGAFKWKTFHYDYTIETSGDFDALRNQHELLAFFLFGIHYYISKSYM